MQFPDYPFEPHFAMINNHRMHYLDEGDRGSDPVVMVHGNPSWSYFYRGVVTALRDSCRCIVPDHIGMGLSDKPPEGKYGYTLSSRIDDLDVLLTELGINGNITLILHDWGGMIGMGYACRCPERIKQIIVMNTAAFHLPGEISLPWQLKLARSVLGPVLVRKFNAFCKGAVKKCVARRPLRPGVAAAYLAPYDSWDNRLAVLRFIQDIPLYPDDPAYDLVTSIDQGCKQFVNKPVLLCWGLQDFVFNRLFLDEWCKRFPHAETHSFEDAGHYLLEDAANEVVPLIKGFLAKHRSAGTSVYTSTNIAGHLTRMAGEQPDDPAVIVADNNREAGRYTYKQLDDASNTLAAGLRAFGVEKGSRVVLMVMPGLEFFALVFAIFKTGAVLVGVDPGMGIKNLGKCLAEAEPEVFIGNGKAHMARRLFRWAGKTLRLKITTEWLPFQGSILNLNDVQEKGKPAGERFVTDIKDKDIAAILFTSGSTGIPKGVVYTHANFNAQVVALQQTFDIKPGEVDLATFPLFALFAPAMGMTSVIPEMDFTRPGMVDPNKIIGTINRYSATTMFGSPALLNRVGRWGEINPVKLKSLKRVLSAGAPVAPVVLERFSKLLEQDVQIHTPYGATESLPVSSINSNEVLTETGALTDQGKGVCIGRAVDGIEIRIIMITDEAIPDWDDSLLLETGETGEIIVAGPQVTGCYFNRDESTLLAKIKTKDNRFYHRMGDLGYFDGRGRLWFCGRKSQRVITPDGTLFTIPCEAVFNTHPLVFRTALVGVVRNGITVPVICVELEPGVNRNKFIQIRKELKETGSKFEHTSGINEFLLHKKFPVDIRHNAKIGRERLANWADGKLK